MTKQKFKVSISYKLNSKKKIWKEKFKISICCRYKRKEKLWQNLNVNNIDVRFEVDTGAAVSLMFMDDAISLFKDSQVFKTNFNLITYCGSKIKIVGFIMVKVYYNNNILELRLHLSKINHKPILGREWFYKLLKVSNSENFLKNIVQYTVNNFQVH